MTTNLIDKPEPKAPSTLQALERWLTRLQALLDSPILTEDALVEITAIYNNASYLLLYLDANDERETLELLKPWRTRLYEDSELDARILSRLRAARFNDAEAEQARVAYERQLEEKLSSYGQIEVPQIEALREQMQTLEAEVANERRAALNHLGLECGDRDPAVLFYHLIAKTEKVDTRAKLIQVWNRAGAKARNMLVDKANSMLALRREAALTEPGAPSVTNRTLARCQVDERQAAEFLEHYLCEALDHHRLLEAEISAVIGVDENPIDHFGHYLRRLYGSDATMLFDLDACLDLACAATKAVLGLELERQPDSPEGLIILEAFQENELAGRINMDVWQRTDARQASNHTLGIRNRAHWREIVQQPEAWVKCHFTPRAEQAGKITFQNVHSIFHEFGHAVNHLLLEGRVPNQSGLEFLPLERLECMSMWFEKWVYHADFIGRLGLEGRDAQRAQLCQEAKKAEYRRTYLERSVTAWLDFECHRRWDGGLEEVFDALDSHSGVGTYVALEDFPAYFSWPMFMANPGANFTYLWGAAWSCAMFEPLFEHSLDELILGKPMRSMFEPCLRASAPMGVPDPAAVFRFYSARENSIADLEDRE